MAERAVRTFAQAFLASWVVLGNGPTWDALITWENLKVAAAATVFAVLTALVTKGVGDPSSASVLTPPPSPAPMVLASPPVRDPLGLPLDPNRVGGRDEPFSEEGARR